MLFNCYLLKVAKTGSLEPGYQFSLHVAVKHPESIIAGLQDRQVEQGKSHQALSDRLKLIEGQISENEKQLGKLLDLYLSGDFEREMLVERRTRLEENLENLRREHTETSAYFQQMVITDNQVEDIRAFCESIRSLLDDATFEQKRQLLEKLDVRGTLTVEENEKVVYVKCLVTPQQRLSLAPTLLSQCSQPQYSMNSRQGLFSQQIYPPGHKFFSSK